MVELLEQAGFQVEYPYLGYPTGFRAVLDNGEGPSAAILVEYDALPGLGQLFYSAVMARDYTMIMGNLVLGAVLTLAGNLLADFCYGLADPRIRGGVRK